MRIVRALSLLCLAPFAATAETITARTSTEEITGIFETVDASGNLVMNTSSGPCSIPAADVYF